MRIFALLLAATFVVGCGATPKPIDKDSIQKNANDNDGDLEREMIRREEASKVEE